VTLDLLLEVGLTTVLLLVQVFSVLLGLVLGLLAVEEVKTLGLEKLVDLGSGKTSKDLLGSGVTDGLALIIPLAACLFQLGRILMIMYVSYVDMFSVGRNITRVVFFEIRSCGGWEGLGFFCV
jgi:hypothetical protein